MVGLFFGVMKMFLMLDCGDGCVTECTENQQTVYFKRMNRVIGELYLNKAIVKRS